MIVTLLASLTIASSPPTVDHNEQGDVRVLQARATRLEEPLLISTRAGLLITPDTLANLWTSGQLLETNGLLLSAQWCSPDLLSCTDDIGQGCNRDECSHFWLVYACLNCTDTILVTSTPKPVNFLASNPNGQIISGVWAGRADLNIDGHTDLTDMSLALQCPDFNLDGQCDSQDFFDWLDEYFKS